MTIEERVKDLEKKVASISHSNIYIKPSELAELMKCSKNHIYIQIRKNNIEAVRIGGLIRIPLSQFMTTDNPLTDATRENDNDNSLLIDNIRNSVFG